MDDHLKYRKELQSERFDYDQTPSRGLRVTLTRTMRTFELNRPLLLAVVGASVICGYTKLQSRAYVRD